MADLGTCLDEHEVVLLGLVLALLRGDFPLVVQVGLVADKDDDDIGTSLATDIVNPFPCLLEGLLAGDVVDDDSYTRVANI